MRLRIPHYCPQIQPWAARRGSATPHAPHNQTGGRAHQPRGRTHPACAAGAPAGSRGPPRCSAPRTAAAASPGSAGASAAAGHAGPGPRTASCSSRTDAGAPRTSPAGPPGEGGGGVVRPEGSMGRWGAMPLALSLQPADGFDCGVRMCSPRTRGTLAPAPCSWCNRTSEPLVGSRATTSEARQHGRACALKERPRTSRAGRRYRGHTRRFQAARRHSAWTEGRGLWGK